MTDRMTILFDTFISEKAMDILKKMADIKKATDTSEESLIREASQVDAIICRTSTTRITRKIIMGTRNLKVIGRTARGAETTDLKAATERKIPVVLYPPGINTIPVTEFTFGLLFEFTKRLSRLNQSFKLMGWKAKDSYRAIELYGKTYGVIGFGSIGSSVAKIAKCLGMRVLVYRKRRDREALKQVRETGAKLVDLETLLKKADFISIHVPLTEETQHMIGAEQLGMMKKTAFLINVARGDVVDEEALYNSIVNGDLAGAGLDVFQMEPLTSDNPLLRLDNVVATPHIAWATHEFINAAKGHISVATDVVRVLQGERPHFIANPEIYENCLKFRK